MNASGVSVGIWFNAGGETAGFVARKSSMF